MCHSHLLTIFNVKLSFSFTCLSFYTAKHTLCSPWVVIQVTRKDLRSSQTQQRLSSQNNHKRQIHHLYFNTVCAIQCIQEFHSFPSVLYFTSNVPFVTQNDIASPQRPMCLVRQHQSDRKWVQQNSLAALHCAPQPGSTSTYTLCWGQCVGKTKY